MYILNLYEHFDKARDMIFNAKNIALLYSNPRQLLYNNFEWNSEYATIQLSFGRQTGSTTWMIKKISELLKCDYEICCITINTKMLENIRQRLKTNKVDSKKILLYSSHQIENITDIKFDYVFVDAASYIESKIIFNIQTNFKAKMFILI